MNPVGVPSLKSCLRLPVLQSKRQNAREFAGIVCHERQVVTKRTSSDLEIVRPDRLALPYERTTDFSALCSACVIEREG